MLFVYEKLDEYDESDDEYFEGIADLVAQSKKRAALEADTSSKRSSRSVKKKKGYRFRTTDKDGKTVPLDPRNSLWWHNYIGSPQLA